jgi:hypothetical protein
MAVFYRQHFKTGIMIIEDQDAEGNPVKKMIRAKDNGEDVVLQNETFVRGKYIGWLHDDKAAMRAAKDAEKQRRADAKKPKGPK